MRLPRFSTLQLVLLTTLIALLTGLFTSAWRLRPQIGFAVRHNGPCEILVRSGQSIWLVEDGRMPLIPIQARLVQIASPLLALAFWAAAWGIVRKRSQQSLTKAAALCPSDSAPLAM